MTRFCSAEPGLLEVGFSDPWSELDPIQPQKWYTWHPDGQFSGRCRSRWKFIVRPVLQVDNDIIVFKPNNIGGSISQTGEYRIR